MIEVQFVIVVVFIVGAFIAGLKLADHYNGKASADRDYALEQQYVRLLAHVDADDPAKPYVAK
jgi:hypothetical protein